MARGDGPARAATVLRWGSIQAQALAGLDGSAAGAPQGLFGDGDAHCHCGCGQEHDEERGDQDDPDAHAVLTFLRGTGEEDFKFRRHVGDHFVAIQDEKGNCQSVVFGNPPSLGFPQDQ